MPATTAERQRRGPGTLRLLLSAVSIVEDGQPRVRFEGTDLAYLLSVRNGEHTYEALLERAETLRQRCLAAAESSGLPQAVDPQWVDALLGELTASWERRQR